VFGLERLFRLLGRGEMDCVEVRKLSSDYLEGGLSPSRLQRVRAHLSDCALCRAFIDSLASMVGMLTNLPPMQSPPGLKQSIMGTIRENGGDKGR
jgi:predicted anti-sigma-YlaC factor YlaD